MSDTLDPSGSKMKKPQEESLEKGDQLSSNQMTKKVMSKTEQARRIGIQHKTSELDRNGKDLFHFF